MDYFGYQRRRDNSLTQDRLNAPLPAPQTPGGRRGLAQPGSLENLRRNPASSIRISRLPSGNAVPQLRPSSATTPAAEDTAVTGRRRSSSEPKRYSGSHLAPPGPDLSHQRTAEPEAHMPTITEGESSQPRQMPSRSTIGEYHEAVETPYPVTPGTPGVDEYDAASTAPASRVASGASALNSAGNAARQNRGLRRLRTNASMKANADSESNYEDDVVDFLDLVGKCVWRPNHASLTNS